MHATETTIGDVLRSAAACAPDQAGLIFDDRQWSYRELLSEAEDAARALLTSFSPGDVVAVWAENCPRWVALEFAAGLAGLTLVPVSPAAGADELVYVLAHSGARGIFIGSDRPDPPRVTILRSVKGQLPSLRFVISLDEWDAFRAIGSLELAESVTTLPSVDPDSTAQILYTSGTTGRPKATLLTHRALTNNARLAARTAGGQDGDTIVNPLPLSSIAGCALMTLGVAQLAGTHVLMREFDPALQLTLTEKHGGAMLCGTPAMLAVIAADPSFGSHDLRSVRVVTVGGGPFPPDLALKLETRLGVPVLTALAQTESGGVIMTTSPDDTLADRLGGAGRPLPGTEVKIADPRTGVTMPCGEIGEIRVRGYQVMRGYLDDPRSTATAIDSGGWLRTGDLGAMDTRGYCRVLGRVNELIVRGGQCVYPREVESLLLEHPAVAEVAVVGVQDRFWGETVAAIVRLSSPVSAPAAELTEFCRSHLTADKVPVRWLFVDSFPRTPDGKVCKTALGARLADASEPDWQSWTNETPTALAEVLGANEHDPVNLTGPLAELLGLRVPQQTPRSKALEDIDF